MKANEVTALLRLAALQKSRDMAEMRRISLRLGELGASRDGLGKAAWKELPRLGADDPAVLAAYGRWSQATHVWRRKMDAAETALEAEREAARTLLRRSFGQTQALEALQKKAKDEERRVRNRAMERAGQPYEE
ncbi:MAG: hypothetical protein AAGI50_05395 [Pseudomonadota bacterium]